MTNENVMDIVFINPAGLYSSGFPYGIAMLAAVLESKGYKVAVVDASAEGLDVQSTSERVLELNPKVIGITGKLHHSAFNRDVSALLRERRSSIVQVAGGYWANPAAEFILRNTAVDYVVSGEADLIIEDVLLAAIGKASICDVAGVSYIDGLGKYVEKPSVKPPHDLDKLPLPAYHLFDMKFYISEVGPRNYHEHVFWRSLKSFKEKKKNAILKLGSMQSGRGCYGKCTFCAAAELLRRNFSVKYVLDHMEFMMQNYGINIFNFTESLTLTTSKWVKEFCTEILNRRLDISYIVVARADFAYDDEVLDLLAKSGCITVGIGFESVNLKMLKQMNKRVTAEKYYKILADFEGRGIKVCGSFIFNMPGENIESMNETITFIKRSKLPASVGFAYPYPGTQLYEFATKHTFCSISDVMFTTANKRMTTKAVFREYIRKYNFNEMDPEILWEINKSVSKIVFHNLFLARIDNRHLRKVLDLLPQITIFWMYGTYLRNVARSVLVRFGRLAGIF